VVQLCAKLATLGKADSKARQRRKRDQKARAERLEFKDYAAKSFFLRVFMQTPYYNVNALTRLDFRSKKRGGRLSG